MSERERVDPMRDTSWIGLERIVMLSDGVFAIAITLLVLNLRVPDLPAGATSGAVAHAVRRDATDLLAFAISFVVIAAYWVAHHRIFSRIRRADGRLLWLNFGMLFLISFLPFPTALLARYGDTFFAVAFYAVVQVAIGVSSTTIWRYATSGHRLVDPDLPESIIRSGQLRGLVVPTVFLFSIPVALWSTSVARFSWLAIGFGQQAIVRWMRRSARGTE